MDFDTVESTPWRAPLPDGTRAVLENAKFELSPVSEGLANAAPIKIDFEAKLNNRLFAVICVNDPDWFGEEVFRTLVKECRNHQYKVMMVSDGFFTDAIISAAEELSVMLTDQSKYRSALSRLPQPEQQRLSETTETEDATSVFEAENSLGYEVDSTAHQLPPISIPVAASTTARSKKSFVGTAISFVILAIIAAVSWKMVYQRIKGNYVIAKANHEIETLTPAVINELVQSGMVKTRAEAGLTNPVFNQNNISEMISSIGEVPEEQTLKELYGVLNPGFRIADSALLVAESSDALVTKVQAWPPLSNPDDKVEFGNVVAFGPSGSVWAWVYRGISISRKQQLDDALKWGGIFSLKCSHCDVDSTYTLSAHAMRLVSPVCKDCGLIAHLFAPDTEGDFRRACDFLTGFQLPEAAIQKHRYSEVVTAKEDVMAHWQAILDRCDYEYDSSVDRDIWKLPEQTWSERLGDCEDTSILLTDALISSGYEARVAYGIWQGEGHAWCVVRVDGRQYILETTRFHTGAVGMRSIVKVGGEYIAQGSFDRNSVYLRRNAANLSTLDYFSDNYWLKMDVNEKLSEP